MKARDARNVVLLWLLTTVLFADVLFLGNGFFQRDLFRYHYPMKKVVRETIAGGEFPYWNRYWSGGQPMAANPAYEIFYPPQWLIFVGSYDFGFNLHIVFHVYLALIGMYLLIRALGARPLTATFAALSFSLSGFFLGSMTTLPTFFVWAWAPLAGWAVVRCSAAGAARSRYAIAAAVLSMQLLVGEPVALLQVWGLLTIFVLWTRGWRGFAVAAGLLGAALALSAVQIIPAIDHAADSVRSRGFALEVVTDYSMPPIRPLELFVPRLFGILDSRQQAVWGAEYFARRTPYLLSISCGLAVTILALGGLLARARGSLAVISIGVVSYVLAIGDATPFYGWLYELGVRSLRYPEKFMAAFIFVLVIFAAMVLERFLDGDARIRRWVRIAAWATVVIAASPLLFWQWSVESIHLFEVARTMWLGGVSLAAAWAILALLPPGRSWAYVALFILLIDVAWLGREASPALPRDFWTPPPITKSLDPDRKAWAIFHRGEWIRDANYWNARQLPVWLLARDALLPITPAAWGLRSALELDFDETALLPTHDLLDLMMRYGSSGAPDWSDPFFETANVRYIIDYAPEGLAVTKVPNRGWYYSPEAQATVIAIHERSNEAVVDVETPSEAQLIAVVTRHKYWSAYIAGREMLIAPANIAFQSVMVPPGRHRITWRYRNPLILWSGVFSAAAWLVAAFVITTRRRPPLPLQNGS